MEFRRFDSVWAIVEHIDCVGEVPHLTYIMMKVLRMIAKEKWRVLRTTAREKWRLYLV